LTIVGVHPFVFFAGIVVSKRSTLGAKTKLGATMEGEDLLLVPREKEKRKLLLQNQNL
jgi:hypothetical protein